MMPSAAAHMCTRGAVPDSLCPPCLEGCGWRSAWQLVAWLPLDRWLQQGLRRIMAGTHYMPTQQHSGVPGSPFFTSRAVAGILHGTPCRQGCCWRGGCWPPRWPCGRADAACAAVAKHFNRCTRDQLECRKSSSSALRAWRGTYLGGLFTVHKHLAAPAYYITKLA